MSDQVRTFGVEYAIHRMDREVGSTDLEALRRQQAVHSLTRELAALLADGRLWAAQLSLVSELDRVVPDIELVRLRLTAAPVRTVCPAGLAWSELRGRDDVVLSGLCGQAARGERQRLLALIEEARDASGNGHEAKAVLDWLAANLEGKP